MLIIADFNSFFNRLYWLTKPGSDSANNADRAHGFTGYPLLTAQRGSNVESAPMA